MTNLVVIGGFLGSGKTTAILAMAKLLLENGQKVGIVTNDQGSDLVDTAFLAKEGLPVLEVNGGCFCCHFDEFASKVSELAETQKPDIVLAEPVGSCTDLIATIFKPLQRSSTLSFSLRPLSILVDPKRATRLMEAENQTQKNVDDENVSFPDEINYLFKKQLEEADILLLNKTDTLSEYESDKLLAFLRSIVPTAEVMAVSAKTGIHIAEWAGKTATGQSKLQTIKEFNYDTYAKAEAMLGWLNSIMTVDFNEPMNVNDFSLSVMLQIRAALINENKEIAHLKMYVMADNEWLKISLVSVSNEPEFNRQMQTYEKTVNIVMNARANIEPDLLQQIVETVIQQSAHHAGGVISNLKTASFSPAKPNPTYRLH